MRRNRKKYKILKCILIISFFIMIIGISYSYLSTSLSISGDVSGNYSDTGFIIDEGSNPNLAISQSKITRWAQSNLNYYQYSFNLKNIGNINYDNFKITFTFNNNINMVDIWNHQYTISNNVLIVSNPNYDLRSNKSTEIGFIVSSSSPILNVIKIKLESSTSTEEVDPSKFKVVFNKTGGWGNYTYQYDVTVTNLTGKRITYWELNVTLPEGTSYVNGWNAVFETSNNILIIKNASHNGRLKENESTTFGLQLNTNIINFIPTDIRIIVR